MWECRLFKFSILPGITLLKKIWIEKFNFVMCFSGKAACYERN